jgi:hypothetical protein
VFLNDPPINISNNSNDGEELLVFSFC